MNEQKSNPTAPPTGPWLGYYLYSPGGQPHGQRMDLSFAGGIVSGNGQDDIGAFDVAGSYSTDSGLVSWLKTYRNTHSVSYRGYFEKGSIYGGWKIDSECHGGFKIWPVPPGTVGNANSEVVAASLKAVLTRYARANGLSLQQAFDGFCGGTNLRPESLTRAHLRVIDVSSRMISMAYLSLPLGSCCCIQT